MRLRLPIPQRGQDAISPTAHYTGHVWVRNGLSHPNLATLEGRLFYDALTPLMTTSRAVGGPTLEGLLLARHRVIDDLLTAAIESRGVSQVVEIACGMSPRGWRFAERYGERLTYVEADLAPMAERKRRALERIGETSGGHRVVEVDALRDDGAASVHAVCSLLDETRGLAIVTEGLLTYLSDSDVVALWRRFARELRRFRAGVYLSDLRLGGTHRALVDRAFLAGLSSFVGRPVHAHFEGEREAARALSDAGFARTVLHGADRHRAAGDAADDPAAKRIRIVEASA